MQITRRLIKTSETNTVFFCFLNVAHTLLYSTPNEYSTSVECFMGQSRTFEYTREKKIRRTNHVRYEMKRKQNAKPSPISMRCNSKFVQISASNWMIRFFGEGRSRFWAPDMLITVAHTHTRAPKCVCCPFACALLTANRPSGFRHTFPSKWKRMLCSTQKSETFHIH